MTTARHESSAPKKPAKTNGPGSAFACSSGCLGDQAHIAYTSLLQAAHGLHYTAVIDAFIGTHIHLYLPALLAIGRQHRSGCTHHVVQLYRCSVCCIHVNLGARSPVIAFVRLDGDGKNYGIIVLWQHLTGNLWQLHFDTLIKHGGSHHENHQQHQHHVDVGHHVHLCNGLSAIAYTGHAFIPAQLFACTVRCKIACSSSAKV